ncbi:regulator of volume decrease after cellular swelling-domain-containing protein [Venturia nashicola]|uniref:Regulator of volume decrease after cellular swelling-domain-containing protein n=1 Tax=Venturia nashicola TaxID=86259 RepID=A0A4Z1P1Y7_9PEZI|nr:regulator of volume decrease after cellular swelling-domain-containing protein [Venturia nashicola]
MATATSLVKITEAPNREEFAPLILDETPTTFFGSKPVLHHHSANATIVVAKSQYDEFSILQDLQNTTTTTGGAPNGDSAVENVTITGVGAWVTSKDFTLFSPATGKGISIPYPSIGIHALGSYESKAAIILQLNLHDADTVNSDDDFETLDLNLIPTESPTSNGTDETPNPAKSIFEALSACADLHPDPASDEEGEEEAEDTAPGAGGWITSENMDQFLDADGNFIGGGVLGAGAGTIRTRNEDVEDADGDGVETKWSRTE